MHWNDWTLKKKLIIGYMGLIILYILTIPIRDYGFLTGEVTLLTHLLIIIILIIIYSILITILDFIIKIKTFKRKTSLKIKEV